MLPRKLVQNTQQVVGLFKLLPKFFTEGLASITSLKLLPKRLSPPQKAQQVLRLLN